MFSFLKPTSLNYQDLTPAQFAAGLGQPGAVLVDVRRPEEFAQGHLPGALNLDSSSLDFARRVAALDPSRPTYVYCRSGARSAKAARQLGVLGFRQVHNLLGGVLDWPHRLVG